MNTIKLSIVTPQGIIFQGDVKSATLPGKDGEFGVLPGHCSLLSLLQVGVIELEKQDSTEAIAINWGYAKVSQDKIDILIDSAVAINSPDASGDMADRIGKAKDLIHSVSNAGVLTASIEAKINLFA